MVEPYKTQTSCYVNLQFLYLNIRMSVLAVAGGTGGVGRTIVDELVAQGKHKIIILSRKVGSDLDRSRCPLTIPGL